MSVLPDKILLATDASKEAELAARSFREVVRRTDTAPMIVGGSDLHA